MFYTGIVEDNSSDSLHIGICKVRIFGIHTDDKKFLPTKDLPNAYPVSGMIGNISGISSFVVPEVGSCVICGFLDEMKEFYIGVGHAKIFVIYYMAIDLEGLR